MFQQLVRLFLSMQRRLLLWAFCAAVLAGAWAMLFGRGPLMGYLDELQKNSALHDKIDRLEEEISELEREKAMLDRGGFETEKTAREQLHLSLPGEDVLYLEFPERDKETEDSEPAESTDASDEESPPDFAPLLTR